MKIFGDPSALRIEVPGGWIFGDLAGMAGAKGVVIFAHGSGSSRFSPRNQAVARHLQRVGLGTLLVDLLTDQEAQDGAKVFDVAMLAHRVILAAQWVRIRPEGRELPLGYFGASTGAAAALTAAARRPNLAQAVVSRGGRPDLADGLEHVHVPTLLIVGGLDGAVVELNRRAFEIMACPGDLRIVPGATHLFEEPGALELVGKWAGEWFLHYFSAGAGAVDQDGIGDAF